MKGMFSKLNNNFNSVFAYLLLIISLLVLSFFVIYNADWAFGDQLQFLKTTAIGKVLPINNYIIPSLGRFFPLGLMDYNLLLLFPNGESALAHYTLNIISFFIFIITSSFLYYVILNGQNKSRLNAWTILFIVLFLAQRTYLVFLDLIFPERIIVTLLSVFIFFTWKFYKTDKWIFGIVSLFSAVYLVYCKEPLFGALIVFALMNIFFNWKELSRNNRIFQILIILNSLVFIVLYYFLVYRGINGTYDGSHGESNWIGMVMRMIWSHKIVIVGIFIAISRFYKIVFKKERDQLFYDGLLFSGLAYFVACLILKLNFTYYYLPAVILFTPPIVYWLMHYVKPIGLFMVMFVFALFYVVKLPLQISQSQNSRINTYRQIEPIANYYKEGYQLVWYEVNPEDESWNSTLRLWRKESLQSYIAYILRDEDFNFISMNSFLT